MCDQHSTRGHLSPVTGHSNTAAAQGADRRDSQGLVEQHPTSQHHERVGATAPGGGAPQE